MSPEARKNDTKESSLLIYQHRDLGLITLYHTDINNHQGSSKLGMHQYSSNKLELHSRSTSLENSHFPHISFSDLRLSTFSAHMDMFRCQDSPHCAPLVGLSSVLCIKPGSPARPPACERSGRDVSCLSLHKKKVHQVTCKYYVNM